MQSSRVAVTKLTQLSGNRCWVVSFWNIWKNLRFRFFQIRQNQRPIDSGSLKKWENRWFRFFEENGRIAGFSVLWKKKPQRNQRTVGFQYFQKNLTEPEGFMQGPVKNRRFYFRFFYMGGGHPCHLYPPCVPHPCPPCPMASRFSTFPMSPSIIVMTPDDCSGD